MKTDADTVSLFIGGDFFASRLHADVSGDHLFGELDDELRRADLRLLNVEAPISVRGEAIVKSGPPLRMPPDVLRLLEGRFDVALLANNHILDFGPDAMRDTLPALRGIGMACVGVGSCRAEAEQPLITEKKGMKIAIVNVCENEFSVAGAASAGAAGLHPFELLCAVRRLAETVDAVVVTTHGGNEMNPLPSPRVQWMNRALVEAGAAAVVNSHPHVPQGIETWRGRPIAYSVGNFLFELGEKETPSTPLWWLAMPVRLELRKSTDGLHASLIPLPMMFEQEARRLRKLTAEELPRFEMWLSQVSGALADPRMVERYFNAWAADTDKGYFRSADLHRNWLCQSDEDRRQFARYKNLWRCEAHNELLTTFMELAFSNQLEDARQLKDVLDCWRKGIPR